MVHGISTFAIIDEPLEKGMEKLIHQGWKQIEIMCEKEGLDCLYWSDKKWNRIKQLLNNEGVSITFHSPITGSNPASNDENTKARTWARLKRCYQLALELESPYVLLHPGESVDKEEGIKRSAEFINNFLLDNKSDQLMVIENVPPYEGLIGSLPEELVRICNKIEKRNNIGIVYDTGHANLLKNISVSEGLDIISNYLKGLHVSDNLGEEDEHLKIGDGNIDFHRVIQKCKELDLHVVFENLNIQDAYDSSNTWSLLQRQ